MSFLSFSLSPCGRLSPRAFAIAIALVYLAAFASQMLLATPVMARAGLMPFALTQLILLWVWFALHAKRLHDSQRSVGWAIAVGLIYALGVILLVLLVELMVGTTTRNANGGEMTGATFLQLFVVLSLLGAFGDPNLGAFGWWMIGIVALILAPVFVALAFSIWTATRRGVASLL
jgi:uncharacterized membrane protein YhaH (DUF805 family)